MTLIYWIKFERGGPPCSHSFINLQEMLFLLERLMFRYGPIEWMIKQ